MEQELHNELYFDSEEDDDADLPDYFRLPQSYLGDPTSFDEVVEDGFISVKVRDNHQLVGGD